MPRRAEPRALEDGEWADLRASVNQVFRPGAGDLTQDSPLLFDPDNRNNLRVIVRDGGGADGTALRVVAHAGFVIREAMIQGRRIRVACIGAVFTLPAERGQGLASLVLEDALKLARPNADLVLVSGDRDLYRRQGLQPIPPLGQFRIRGAETPVVASTAGDPDLSVRDASVGDLQAMAELYDGEDIHFVRPATDWRRLWGAGLLMDAPAAFSVIIRRGRIVAYVGAQREGRRPDGSVRQRRILEIAGDRDAILDVAENLGDELLLPAYDSSTIALCQHKGKGNRWLGTNRQLPITGQVLTAGVLVIPWYGLNYL